MSEPDMGGEADIIRLGSEDKPVLFISHRHNDRAIADVIRKFTSPERADESLSSSRRLLTRPVRSRD